ncbi:MAG: transcription termination/antitermination protein NusA [Candidatus Marinimicrobia bacterium]|nr:transcription termination/antitermination protein NusA [Candidatus Neomarinimicrobiota bacterium]
MVNKHIIEAFVAIAREKNIDRTNLGTIIEELFMSLIHKKYGEDRENFSVIVNMEKGEIEIYQEKTVVEEVFDPVCEISIENALKEEPDLEIDDLYIEIIDPADFGRRLINTAKQFLSQKIREVEKMSVYDDYFKKVGEVIIGTVHQIQRDNLFVNIDKVEMKLPRNEQIDNDRYRRGDNIRSIIKTVEWSSKGPEIILSRSDNDFVKKLFEMEVPEVEDGIIEIKSVSRAAGDRCKVVVYSSDRRIDAVGSCVGMRGSRIQAIVRELNGEKIDIINYSDRPEILISRALSPAKPIDLYIDEDRPYVVAVFEDDELPIAIGRNGQNIRLASDVTGFTIDAVKKSDYEGEKTEIYLDEVNGISNTQLEELTKLNITTGNDFLDAERKSLLSINGFGEKTIDKIAKNILEKIELLSLDTDEEVEGDSSNDQLEQNTEEVESL